VSAIGTLTRKFFVAPSCAAVMSIFGEPATSEVAE